MHKSTLWPAAAVFAACLPLASCVDDNYDLSDIDTTSRIPVTDLTLPVNIDPVRLGDIIKIDDGSKIQSVTIDGKEFYALRETGSFFSDPIEIAGVSAAATPIAPEHETLDKIIGPMGSRHGAPGLDVSYQMVEMGNSFSYHATNIDEAIVRIDRITTEPFMFRLNLEVEDRNGSIERMSFTDMVISVPKGLTAKASVGDYNPVTGLWSIPEVLVESNRASLALVATGVDMNMAGAKILADRSLEFDSEFIVKEGRINILASRFTMPDQVGFDISFDLSDFTLTSFTGDLKYDIEGIDIDPVNITDIPEFLQGGETNIGIANPQIYLSLNNPVANEGVEIRTGIEIEAYRATAPVRTFTCDEEVVLKTNHGVAGPYNFVLSPDAAANNVPDDFKANLTPVKFSTLGQLLATPDDWAVKGIPSRIGIDLLDPRIPTQHVEGFRVPNTITGVEGKWELLAPLALNDGSKIIYTETRDGWADEDLDDLTVTRLDLTAKALNNCPVAISLTVYPIDKEGHNFDGCVVKSSRLEPGVAQELTISMTGEFSGLDGIRLEAVLEGVPGGKPLDPAQTLQLGDIRATVSGYYQKKF